MSLLQVVKDACDLLSLARPSAVINSNDTTIRQLFGLAVVEANELAQVFDWEALTEEHTFVTVAAAEQTDTPIPADFNRFVNQSFYNRTTRRPVYGPVTPREWQLLQANPQAGRVILGYRRREGTFLMTPTPPVGQTIAFEYISYYWAKTADGLTAKAVWTLDTDLTYLPEDVIKLGIVWRWRAAKKFGYAEEYDNYTKLKELKQARDGGSTNLSLVATGGDDVTNPFVGETDFG